MSFKKLFNYWLAANIFLLVACETNTLEPDVETIQNLENDEPLTNTESLLEFEVTDNSSLNESTKELYLNHLKNIGFGQTNVIFEENELFVDGDLVLSYSDIPRENTNSTANGLQRAGTTTRDRTVYYKLAPMRLFWKEAFFSATKEWEKLLGSDFKFLPGVSWGTNLNVSEGSLGNLQTDDVVYGSPPSETIARSIGSIRVNSEASLRPQQERIAWMMHAIGHAVGLKHTDEKVGSRIYCTTDRDHLSIMNSTGPTKPVFSNHDRMAILSLFRTTNPIITQVNGTKNVGQEGRLLIRWNRNRIIHGSTVKVHISVDGIKRPNLSYTTNNDGYDKTLRPIDFRTARVPGYENRDNYYFGCVQVTFEDPSTEIIYDDESLPHTFKHFTSGGSEDDNPKNPKGGTQ